MFSKLVSSKDLNCIKCFTNNNNNFYFNSSSSPPSWPVHLLITLTRTPKSRASKMLLTPTERTSTVSSRPMALKYRKPVSVVSEPVVPTHGFPPKVYQFSWPGPLIRTVTVLRVPICPHLHQCHPTFWGLSNTFVPTPRSQRHSDTKRSVSNSICHI